MDTPTYRGPITRGTSKQNSLREIIGAMTIKSNKQKGRRLQQWVVSKLLLLLPGVKTDDVVSRPMGSNGDDIMLSPYARKLFPYSIECKNRQDFKQLYNYWSQTKSHSNLEPLLVVKMNRERPLAIIDLEHLFELVKEEV